MKSDRPINEKIVGDSTLYEKAIVDLISSTMIEPNYTIWIYGDWGTGKTTLMRGVYENLEKSNKNIINVWFNSWLYEKEKEFALIPLLITMGNKLGEKEEYKYLSQRFKTLGLSLLTHSPEIASLILSAILGGGIPTGITDISSKVISESTQPDKTIPKTVIDTIYYKELEKIREEITSIIREDVTACLLSRVNGFGVKVGISRIVVFILLSCRP